MLVTLKCFPLFLDLSFRIKIPSFLFHWVTEWHCDPTILAASVMWRVPKHTFLLLKSSRANQFASMFFGISACISDEHSRNDCHNLKCCYCSNPEKDKDTFKISVMGDSNRVSQPCTQSDSNHVASCISAVRTDEYNIFIFAKGLEPTFFTLP